MNLESLIDRVSATAQNVNEANLLMVAAATLAHWIGEIEEKDAKVTGEELRQAVINGLHCKEATARDYDTLGRKLCKRFANRKAAILAADTEQEALILMRAEITVLCISAQLPPAVNSLKTVLASPKAPKAQKSEAEKALAALAKVQSTSTSERKAFVQAILEIVGMEETLSLAADFSAEYEAATAAAAVHAAAQEQAAEMEAATREAAIAAERAKLAA